MSNEINMENYSANNNSQSLIQLTIVISPPNHGSDKLNMLMIFGLYITWGLLFGYYSNSVNIVLINSGASYSSLSGFSFITLPFTFKFLFAPIVDSYYFKSIGKHKTYILSANYLISGFLLLNSFFMDQWIDNLDITKITVLGFLVMIPFSFQSMALDAWPTTLLNPENKRYVGYLNNIGQMFGQSISFNLFIWLHSKDFCNEYIYSTYHDQPLLSNFWMLVGLAIVFFTITLCIHIFQKDINPPSKKFQNTKEFLKTISRLIINPNLRFFIFVTFVMGAGLQPIEFGYMFLLKKGFSQNILSLLVLISEGVVIFIGIFGSYIAKKNKEFTCILIIFVFNIIGDMFYFFFVYYYKNFETKMGYVFYIMEDLMLRFTALIRYVLFVSFVLRITDEKMTAVYTVFFYSVANLNAQWTQTLSLFLIDYIDYTLLCWIGVAISITFFLVFGKRMRQMEITPKEFWMITEEKYELFQN